MTDQLLPKANDVQDGASAGAHTPGPWIVADPQTSSRRVFMPADTVEIRSRAYGGMVACLYRENFTPEQDAANARLIAAAPAMYEYIKDSASAGCATAKKILEQARGQAHRCGVTP